MKLSDIPTQVVSQAVVKMSHRVSSPDTFAVSPSPYGAISVPDEDSKS